MIAHKLPTRLVLGHRGSPFELPENTLSSFRRALAAGADGVELDVQPSADAEAVVIHDATLERTTNGRGRVSGLPWATLARLDAGGEPIPRLDAVAAWAAEAGAWLNVELKATGAEAASLRAIRDAGLLERTIFSSFDPTIVGVLGLTEPDALRFLLVERWDEDARLAAARCGAQGICVEDSACTTAVLDELRGAGLAVVAWTVDEPRRIAELLSADVVAVITNRPLLAAQIRRVLKT